MRKPIGQVAPAERRIIHKLHERRSSLRELLLSLDPEADAELIRRVDADKKRTDDAFAAWWADMAAKYSWHPGSYEIDFETGNILPYGK